MNSKEKVEKINKLSRKIEENKDFLEVLKLVNKHPRDNKGNILGVNIQNKLRRFQIAVNVFTEEGSSDTRFADTKDYTLMNNLQQTMIEKIEKHVEIQEKELLSFFK